MQSKISLNSYAMISLMAMIFIISSCKKADTIGLEVLPDDDRLEGSYTDTITLNAFTLREDSISTSGTTFHLLGSHNDPIFGYSKASIYTQLRLSAANPDFGTNPQLDSVVLSLAYAGYATDIMKLGGEQSFSVHRLLEDMIDTVSYYSNDSLSYQKLPLGTYSGFVKAKDSVYINGVSEPPQMRIRLSNSFGNEILSSTSLTSDENFLDVFKGFYITATTQNLLPGTGTLAYINPASTYTKMTLYYHNDDTTAALLFNFVVNSSTKRFNNFEHDYSSAIDINAQLADTTLGVNGLYLQAMAGLKAKITFPYINNLQANGRKIAVNKAELIFSVSDNTTDRHSPPARLAIVKKGDDGVDKVIDDNIYESTDFVGGSYSSSNKRFSFNIPRHIQSLLNDTTADKSVYLRVTSAAVSGNRVVLNGTGNTDKPLKLRLTYTIID